MTLSIVTPATIFDMAELGGARSQVHWAVVREMWSEGESFALRAGDRLLGIFGLYPVDGGAEAWFNVHPDAAQHMRFIVRHIRLTLVTRHYPEIVVFCATEAGRRIARLSGFEFVQHHPCGEIWHVKHLGRGLRLLESGGSTETGS